MSESKDHPGFLPTVPGTQVMWVTDVKRGRPCWRCRFHLRWPPWRKHWGCTFGPQIKDWA